MTRVYTDEWNGFQFRAPVYIDGHFDPYKFDLVLWQEHKPYEVVDSYSGKRKMCSRSCFSVAQLDWDTKDHCFDFRSIGLRYLQYRIDGLEKFIMDFCESMEDQLYHEED